MTYTEVKYYWEQGAVTLKQMQQYVVKKVITKEEYHEITGKYYE